MHTPSFRTALWSSVLWSTVLWFTAVGLLVHSDGICQTPQPQAPDAGQAAPGDIVAQWRQGDRKVSLTRNQLHLELANHYRRRDEGVEAARFLTENALVKAEAIAEDAMPDPATVRAVREQLAQQLESVGRRLEDEPAFKNMSQTELDEYLAVGLAQQELTRRAAGLDEGEQPDADLVSLWMTEARARHKIVTDADKLPSGVIATVDDKEISLLDLGRVVARTTPPDELPRFIRQVVLRQLLAEETSAAGITISNEDLDKALQARRAAVESNPSAKGVPYEELLRSVGHTEATLREDPAFLANLQRQLLVERIYSDDVLRGMIAKDPEGIRAQHGARRHVAVLFLRASDEDNPLVPRDFASAEGILAKLRGAVVDGTAPFPEVALRFSEHVPTKRNRGDAGWLQRASNALPEPVLAKAWELAIHELSEPVRSDEGVWLIRTLEVEPPATEAVLMDRMRRSLEVEYAQDLLKAADIRYL